jgi:hypothetical protein
MKRLLFAITILFLQNTLYAFEFTAYWTLPSLSGLVNGEGSEVNQLSDNVKERWLLPFVGTKIAICKIGESSFFITGGFSLYFEDKGLEEGLELASVNSTLGFGITMPYNEELHLAGLSLFTVYPMYDFPFAVIEGTPKQLWKFAVDIIDIAVTTIPRTPFFISLYWRLIFFMQDKQLHIAGAGDVGITLGFHYSSAPNYDWRLKLKTK